MLSPVQGRSECSAPDRDSLTPFPALGHLCSLLWAPASSITSSQRSGSGSGRVLQRAGCSAASPPARRPHQGDGAQRGSTSPTPALEAEGFVVPDSSWGFQCWPSPCLGRPALSRQQAQALITLWFLSLLFKNKTQQKRGRRRALTASLRSPCMCLRVAQASRSWQGTWGARHLGASPCVSCL